MGITTSLGILLIYGWPYALVIGQLIRVPVFPGVVLTPSDALLIIASLLLLPRIKWKDWKHGMMGGPWSWFIASIILSLLMSVGRYSIGEYGAGAAYAVRYIAICMTLGFLNRAEVERMIIHFRNAGIVFVVIGLIQFIFYSDLRNLEYLGWDPHFRRLFSTVLDPNIAGSICIATMIYVLRSMKKSRTAWIALVMSAVASVLTFSRSTYLGCFGSGVIYAVIQKKWVWLCIGVVASGALIAVTTSDNQSYSILRRETALARIGSWEDGVRLIQHAGVFGYGFDMLRSVNEPGFGEKNDHTISHATAGIDNSVLFIIATTGIPGIMAFIWMIFSIYVVALRNMRLRPWLLLYMSAVLIHSFFVHSLFTPWITAGIVLLYQDSNSDQAIIHTNTKKP